MTPTRSSFGKILVFFLVMFFIGLIGLFVKNDEVLAASGPNGSLTVTSYPSIISPGRSFSITVNLCNTSGTTLNPLVKGAIDRDGTIFLQSGGLDLAPGDCGNDTWGGTAPTAVTSDCPRGAGDFFVSFNSLNGFGFEAKRIELYGEVGLTVTNNTSVRILVEVISTNFGGAIGLTFDVIQGQSNGPSDVWSVNCGDFPTVSATVSVKDFNTGASMGSFSGSEGNKNGCHFQIRITVNDPGPGPGPTPPPGPVPPPAPNPNVPSQTCSGSTVTAVLSWGTVSGADGYHLNILAGSWQTITLNGVNNISYSWSGLVQGGTQYWWDVSAFNGAGDGPKTAQQSFTTITCAPAPQPPGEPTDLGEDQSCSGSTVTAVLRWRAAPGPVATGFRVYEWIPPIWVQRADVGVTNWSWNGLSPNTAKTWGVEAYNVDGASSRPFRTFVTMSPCPPVVSRPDLAISTFTLNKSTPFAPGEQVTAQVTVTNQGTAAVNADPWWWTDVYSNQSLPITCDVPNGQAGEAKGSLNIGSLPAGASTGFTTLRFNAPASPGTYTAAVFTDSDCDVPESDEPGSVAGSNVGQPGANNQRMLTYTVGVILVSLTCTADPLPDPPGPHNSLSWTPVAGESSWAVWRSANGAPSVPVASTPNSAYLDSAVSRPGTYNYQVISFPNGLSSNTASCVLAAARPDLAVTAFSVERITPVGPNIQPGESLRARVTVTNLGSVAVPRQWWLDVYKDKTAQAFPITCVLPNGESPNRSSPEGPGVSSSFQKDFTAPSIPGTYEAVAFADSDCEVPEADEPGSVDGSIVGQPGANNQLTAVYTVGGPPPPTPPPPGAGGCTVVPATATAGTPESFTWTVNDTLVSGSGAANYILWWGDANEFFTDTWVRQKTFVRSHTYAAAGSYSPTATVGGPAGAVPLQRGPFPCNAVSVLAAPPVPTPTPVPTPAPGAGSCTISPFSATVGTATTFTWTVTDSLNSGSGATNYTFNWGDFGVNDTPPPQDWQKNPAPFIIAHTYSSAGVRGVTVTIDGPPGAVPPSRSLTCLPPVGVAAGSSGGWFETTSGDVGSKGAITLTAPPPSGKYQSTYLLAGDDLTNVKVAPGGFSVNKYTRPLIPVGGVYNYLAERFLPEAGKKKNCKIKDHTKDKDGDGLFHCAGDAEFKKNAPTGNAIWFVDGNLVIKEDLELAAGDAVTFIVRGNITINADVARADGIYVAGGIFKTSDTGVAGKQLVVNGAVLANTLNLNRTLASVNCGVSPCDNAVNPAERFVYDPKYLVGLNSVLGSPQVAWREVAP